MVMNRRFSFGNVCRINKSKNDTPVQPGLALTPSQMQRMSEKGIPVSAQTNDALFYDGDVRPSFDVPLDLQRGIDVATMWQKRQDIRAKHKKVASELKNVPKDV